jgi:hypothetical protein
MKTERFSLVACVAALTLVCLFGCKNRERLAIADEQKPEPGWHRMESQKGGIIFNVPDDWAQPQIDPELAQMMKILQAMANESQGSGPEILMSVEQQLPAPSMGGNPEEGAGLSIFQTTDFPGHPQDAAKYMGQKAKAAQGPNARTTESVLDTPIGKAGVCRIEGFKDTFMGSAEIPVYRSCYIFVDRGKSTVFVFESPKKDPILENLYDKIIKTVRIKVE